MPFACPKCRFRSMNIISSIELLPDSRSDEIAVQIVKCSRCSFKGLAVYEESRRGALHLEAVDHRGFYMDKATLNTIQNMIERCPNPSNPRCQCSIHCTLDNVNKYGRWIWLDNMPIMGFFKIRLKS